MDPQTLDALAYVNFLSEDGEVISYRPTLSRLVGDPLAAILLQQIVFYWKQQGREPFYKFGDVCKHEWYRAGDSWLEKLAFTRSNLTTAHGYVATKITAGVSKSAVLDDVTPIWTEAGRLQNAPNLVAYWTDAKRVTWYHVNDVLLGRALKAYYLGNVGIQNSYVKQESKIPGKAGFLHYPSTENTTESYYSRNGGDQVNQVPGGPPKTPGRPVTEAQRQAAEGVANWESSTPGQPTRGPLFEALCKACRVNYYRMTVRARQDFELAIKELREDQRTPEQVQDVFAPAWLSYWRFRDGNRPPTPLEVSREWDNVLDSATAAKAAASKPKGGQNGKGRENANRIQEAADLLA